jgi:surface antigen
MIRAAMIRRAMFRPAMFGPAGVEARDARRAQGRGGADARGRHPRLNGLLVTVIALAGGAGVAAHAQQSPSSQASREPPHRYGWPLRTSGTYVGWSGARWSRDFGVASGRCNRRDIATIVLVPDGRGTLTPQVVAQVPAGYTRNVGTLRGASVAALVGASLNQDLDDQDRDCMGHALEIGKPGRSVSWQNPGTQLTLAITPGRENRSRKSSGGYKCREYVVTIARPGAAAVSKPGVACQAEPGLWLIGP